MGNNSMKLDLTTFFSLYEIVKTYDHGQYQQIKQKASQDHFLLKQLQPNAQNDNQLIRSIIVNKINNKCKYVTQIIHWQEYQSQPYSKDRKHFILVFNRPSIKLRDYCKQKLNNNNPNPFTSQQLFLILQSIVYGLKYFSKVNHLYSSINFDCIQFDGNQAILMDPWLCTFSDHNHSQIQNCQIIYKSPQKQLKSLNQISIYDHFKSNLYEFGLLLLDLALNGKYKSIYFQNSTNKNTIINVGNLLEQINDPNFKSKLSILLNTNPQKRLMIYNYYPQQLTQKQTLKMKSYQYKRSLSIKDSNNQKLSLSKKSNAIQQKSRKARYSNNSSPQKLQQRQFSSLQPTTPQQHSLQKRTMRGISYQSSEQPSQLTSSHLNQSKYTNSQIVHVHNTNIQSLGKTNVYPQQQTTILNSSSTRKFVNANANTSRNVNFSMIEKPINSNPLQNNIYQPAPSRMMTPQKIQQSIPNRFGQVAQSCLPNSPHFRPIQPIQPKYQLIHSNLNTSLSKANTCSKSKKPKVTFNQTPSTIHPNRNQSVTNQIMENPQVSSTKNIVTTHNNDIFVIKNQNNPPNAIQIAPTNRLQTVPDYFQTTQQLQQQTNSNQLKLSPPTPSFHQGKIFKFPNLNLSFNNSPPPSPKSHQIKIKQHHCHNNLQDVSGRRNTTYSVQQQQQQHIDNDMKQKKQEQNKKQQKKFKQIQQSIQQNYILNQIIKQQDKLLQLIKKQNKLMNDKNQQNPRNGQLYNKKALRQQNNSMNKNYENSSKIKLNKIQIADEQQPFHPTTEFSPSSSDPITNSQMQQNPTNISPTKPQKRPPPVNISPTVHQINPRRRYSITDTTSNKIRGLAQLQLNRKPISQTHINPKIVLTKPSLQQAISIESAPMTQGDSILDCAFNKNEMMVKWQNKNIGDKTIKYSKNVINHQHPTPIEKHQRDKYNREFAQQKKRQLQIIEEFQSGTIIQELQQQDYNQSDCQSSGNGVGIFQNKKNSPKQIISNSKQQKNPNKPIQTPNINQQNQIGQLKFIRLPSFQSNPSTDHKYSFTYKTNRLSSQKKQSSSSSNCNSPTSINSNNIDINIVNIQKQEQIDFKYYVIQQYQQPTHQLKLSKLNNFNINDNASIDCERYQGYKQNGCREGHGTYYYKNGVIYEGQWKGDLPNGHGVIYKYINNGSHQSIKRKQNFEILEEGQWENGVFHGSMGNTLRVQNIHITNADKYAPSFLGNIKQQIPICSSYQYDTIPPEYYGHRNNVVGSSKWQNNYNFGSNDDCTNRTGINVDVSNSYLHNEHADNITESKGKLPINNQVSNSNNINNSNNHYMSNSNFTIDRSLISSTLGSSHVFSTKHNQILKFLNGDIFKGTISTNTMNKAKVITGVIQKKDGKIIQGAWEYNQQQNKIYNLQQSLDQSIIMLMKSVNKVN